MLSLKSTALNNCADESKFPPLQGDKGDRNILT